MGIGARTSFVGAVAVFVGAVAVAVLTCAAPAAAQDGGAYVNPYLGYYAFDESSFEDAFDNLDVEESPIVGARLGWSRGAWGLEAAYGRSSVDTRGTREGGLTSDARSVTIDLVYAGVAWAFPIGPVEPFVAAGLGVASYSVDDHEVAIAQNGGALTPAVHEDEGRINDLVVNFGAGLKVALGERLRLRVDAKDHVDLCEASDLVNDDPTSGGGACFDDETLHNIELSGGVEIRL